MEKDEKVCWACKRILIGDSKMGLCPACLNKYGSYVAVFAASSPVVGILLLKNKDKIVETIVKANSIFKA